MADRKKMSVEEILAACRATDGGEGGSAAAESGGAEPQSEAAPAESRGGASSGSSDPQPAAPKKNPREMSVAEILAAARAEKQGGGASKPAPQVAAKVKLEGKPKAPPKKPAAAAAQSSSGKSAVSAPMDTASILAAARSSAKRGPVSKSQAAEEGRPAPRRRTPTIPPKPDFLVRSAAKPAEPETRRGFFGAITALAFGSAMAVGWISLAVTSLLGVLGFARFMFPNILIEPPTRFRVGFKDEFGPGQVQTKFKAQFGVWIVRSDIDGQDVIYALKSVCTHLGCTPNWLEAEQKFKCPCHGSGFYKSGVNFEGPAPRPLERYAIHVADDGQLEVDKSQTFRQEMGQWANPDSYVVV